MSRPNFIALLMCVLAGPWVSGCAVEDEVRPRVVGLPLTINLSTCLGQPGMDSGCLFAQTVDPATRFEGCLALEIDGGPDMVFRSVELSQEWSLLGDTFLDIDNESTVQASLFISQQGAPAPCDVLDGPSVTDPCDGDCLLKLEGRAIQLANTRMIDFRGESEFCNRSWGPGLTPVDRCDGVDNDCDSVIDEESNSAEVCTVGEGLCASEGVRLCVDGSLGECSATPKTPQPERPNGVDEDCDGVIDEGLLNCGSTSERRACPTYELSGVECYDAEQRCQSDGEWGPCRGSNGAIITGPELCDGLDNDCDGTADEDYGGSNDMYAGASCDLDQGACTLPGVLTCLEDELVCEGSAPINEAEVCNGCDDDSDGQIDESGSGAPITVDCYRGPDNTLDIGPCRAGSQTCEGGALSACTGEVLPMREMCDEIDNDCDGMVDEGVQNRCGACGPDPVEVCDEIDNDCDGLVDEEFDLSLPTRCGGCSVDCTSGISDSVMGCEEGSCVVLGCINMADDADGDPSNGCECQRGRPDRPDREGLDSDCDGLDGSYGQAIFVSPLGNDLADGSGRTPLSSLAAALALAEQEGYDQIYLDQGTYLLPPGEARQPFVMPDGVSIYGGFRYNPALATWVHLNEDNSRAEITVLPHGMRFIGLTRPVVLDSVEIDGRDSIPNTQTNSIGILAVNVSDNLSISNTVVRSRNASAGNPSEESPEAGIVGQDGENGGRDLPGTGGSAAECMGGIVSSGAGGDGGGPGLSGLDGQSAGLLNGQGSGGEAGRRPMEDAADGGRGADGQDGMSGPRPSPAGRLSIRDGWAPSDPGPGFEGTPGHGGGGGGGAGVSVGEIGRFGGGGGGSGGCPGGAGDGGMSGYGSFGLIVHGGHVSLIGSRIIAGNGGDGSAGGSGAQGGAGGVGGRGTDDEAAAGAGGDGGRGGCGGHGSGGAGGPSIAILRVGRENDGLAGSTVRILGAPDGEPIPAIESAAFLSISAAGAGARGGERPQCARVGPVGPAGIGRLIGCCDVDGPDGACRGPAGDTLECVGE